MTRHDEDFSEILQRSEKLNMPTWFQSCATGTLMKSLAEVALFSSSQTFAVIAVLDGDQACPVANLGDVQPELIEVCSSAFRDRDGKSICSSNAQRYLASLTSAPQALELPTNLVMMPISLGGRPVAFLAVGSFDARPIPNASQLEQLRLVSQIAAELFSFRFDLRSLTLDLMELVQSQIDRTPSGGKQ